MLRNCTRNMYNINSVQSPHSVLWHTAHRGAAGTVYRRPVFRTMFGIEKYVWGVLCYLDSRALSGISDLSLLVQSLIGSSK